MNNIEPLSQRVDALETRLNQLEARLSLDAKAAPHRPASAPQLDALLRPKPDAPKVAPVVTPPEFPSFAPPPKPTTVTPPSVTPPSVAPPTVTPSSSAALPVSTPAPARGDSLLDWEQLVGGKWALWAGLLSLFCAMASFLAYTWRFLPPPPPGAKVAMGVGAGVAFLVAGEWMRGRAQRWFGEGLSGAGLALCFLSLWAGAAYFSIFPVAPTFGGMAVVVALGVFLALRHDAPGLHILSIIGGFATPMILRGGGSGDSSWALLSYLAILNAGVLGVSLFKRWRASVWLSAAATVALLMAWSLDAPIDAMRPVVWAFVSFYFVLYVGAACFYSLARREDTAPEDIALLLTASALYALVGHNLLVPLLGSFPGAFALGLAVFWGAVCALTARFAPTNALLREGSLALGILAFTVAVPIQFAQPWIGIGWIGEAGVLLWLGRRQNSAFLKRAGQIVWLTALLPLGWEMFSPGARTVWGLHAGGWPWLFGLAISAWNARAAQQENDDWKDAYALVSVGGGAWLLAREVALRSPGDEQIWLVVMALGVYAVAVFGVGAWARFAAVRVGATALAASAALAALWWTSHAPQFDLVPFWNLRWAALAVGLAALSAIYVLAREIEFPLHDAEKEWARAWPLSAFGYGLLAFSSELYFGFAYFGAPDWASRAFFALSMVWMVAASGLLARGLQTGDPARRFGAYVVGAVAIAALLFNALTTSAPAAPFANWRAGAFAVSILALAMVAYRLKRAAEAGRLSEIEADLSATALGAALGLALWVLTQETWEAGRYFAVGGGDWQRGAQMAISLVWSLFGALLLLGGIHWRAQLARVSALALLAATVCKVFLFDLSFLDGASRALSLAGLGIALVFISWLYGRFGRVKVSE